MEVLRHALRRGFAHAERGVGRVFPPAWNPLVNLGAIGFLAYWVITASGIYLYIFFDTGVAAAFRSVESLTHEQWYLGGVMRSLHRYASDLLVVVMLVHIVREFALDRYRGVRWFSWVSGLPVLILVFVAGITGYWLVWDRLAQYVGIVSTEWLDRLGIFGEPLARNFLGAGSVDDRFFTLMIFMHLAVPLIALILLWLHLQRVSKPRINPPRGLAIGVLLAMLALSLAVPATSQGPADLATVPGRVGLDWFYLGLYPLLETLPGPISWGAMATILVIMAALPWLPPLRRLRPATVDLANCNGCTRCFADCPYTAIEMVPRTDGRPFEWEAEVDPGLCVACGICAGACPTATPFRRASALVAGIDLPDRSVALLRDETEQAAAALRGDGRILVFGCRHGVPLVGLDLHHVAAVTLECVGQLPPSFIDYVLSRGLADGVMLTGCAESSCYNRFGIAWTAARLAGTRDPYLRRRVPRERLRTLWAGLAGRGRLESELAAFARDLESQPSPPTPATRHASVQPAEVSGG
jgi:quinol-cytochrome oxidoreductase complex cytochrome b subunit/coenzyme F420-reducing hydrogenase delta subunit